MLEGTTRSPFHSQSGSGCFFFRADFARVLLACWNRIVMSLLVSIVMYIQLLADHWGLILSANTPRYLNYLIFGYS